MMMMPGAGDQPGRHERQFIGYTSEAEKAQLDKKEITRTNQTPHIVLREPMACSATKPTSIVGDVAVATNADWSPARRLGDFLDACVSELGGRHAIFDRSAWNEIEGLEAKV